MYKHERFLCFLWRKIDYLTWLWNLVLFLFCWLDMKGQLNIFLHPRWGRVQKLAFFCSHRQRLGLHIAPRLSTVYSIYQIQKYVNAVSAVFIVCMCMCVYIYTHQQGRPVESCRGLLKGVKIRMLIKASRGREKRWKGNTWKVRGEELVWELL